MARMGPIGMGVGSGVPGGAAQQQLEKAHQQTVAAQQPGAMAAQNPYDPQPRPVDISPITVDPSQLQRLNLAAPTFSAQRSAALEDINTGTASGLAGAQSRLAASGGLSQADRMALASRFNRDKIMGRQQTLGRFAGMEEAARSQIDKANQLYNADMLNRNLYEGAGAQERALQRELNREMLEKQLGASGTIADAQAAAAREAARGGLLGGNIIPGFL